MPDFFKASEILEASIRIEENGRKFYEEAAKKFDDPGVAGLFRHLSEEDARHAGIFSGLLRETGGYEPDESYPGEHGAYLAAFADHHIFNKENTGRLLAARMKSAEEILNFAVRIELESMFFYMEMKRYVPRAHREMIDRIVEEERSHYLKLIQMQGPPGEQGREAA